MLAEGRTWSASCLLELTVLRSACSWLIWAVRPVNLLRMMPFSPWSRMLASRSPASRLSYLQDTNVSFGCLERVLGEWELERLKG